LTEETGIEGWFWEDQFDLSAISYPQFLDFFFDRPIVSDDETWNLFRGGIDSFIASNPATVVAHVQAMCQGFSELTKIYSHEELDQGLGRYSALPSVVNSFSSIPLWISDCESTASSPCTCRSGMWSHTAASM
jgi:hypothetical protein